ncbi:hypothetical protein C8R42DRAFT_715356 [Lentinula raphanica]|nr:hypothetical protein C8R42DRAFT_715356 [Lentinula raphanica]
MTTSSSTRPSPTTLRQLFIADEAHEGEEEDDDDDDYDEERFEGDRRLAAVESVSLRQRDEQDPLQRVIAAWEERLSKRVLVDSHSDPLKSVTTSDCDVQMGDATRDSNSLSTDPLDYLNGYGSDDANEEVPRSVSSIRATDDVEGWEILRMYHSDELDLSAAESKLRQLFGDAVYRTKWAGEVAKIMHVEKDDNISSVAALLAIESHIQRLIPEDTPAVGTRSPSVSAGGRTPSSFEEELEDWTEEQEKLAVWIHENLGDVDYDCGIYHVRCERGQETAIIGRLKQDITAGKVHPNVLKAAFPSYQPGGIYIQVRSMLPINYRLASYLRSIPGLLYPRHPKLTLPLHSDDSTKLPIAKYDHNVDMPIHTLVENAHTQRHLVLDRWTRSFRPGTWAIARTGLYKGNIGLVIEDDANEHQEKCTEPSATKSCSQAP